jgi:hypothetical protein
MLSTKGKAIDAKVRKELKESLVEKRYHMSDKEILDCRLGRRKRLFREDVEDAFEWEEALNKILSRFFAKRSVSDIAYNRRMFALSIYAINLAQEELDYSQEALSRVAEKVKLLATKELDFVTI